MPKGYQVIRIIGLFLFAFAGYWIGKSYAPAFITNYWSQIQTEVIFSLVGAILGYLLTPIFTVYPLMKLTAVLKKTSVTRLTAGFFGLLLGLVGAVLISIPLSFLPGLLGRLMPAILSAVFCYLGIVISVAKYQEINSLLANLAPDGRKHRVSEELTRQQKNVLLDTSVIIDGRIAEIAHTGFIPGTIIIPRFILQELQYIADSEDSLRRQRGRRGLEVLAQLQKEPNVEVKISDLEVDGVKDVDGKLVVLARQLNCKILTNDYNLNKVADLQGVAILNVNDLANAVKSIILPGETFWIKVIQEGKEHNQGVGYMEDGTMVVIENGRSFLNQDICVVVTKILQTAAGRMIFARQDKETGGRR